MTRLLQDSHFRNFRSGSFTI